MQPIAPKVQVGVLSASAPISFIAMWKLSTDDRKAKSRYRDCRRGFTRSAKNGNPFTENLRPFSRDFRLARCARRWLVCYHNLTVIPVLIESVGSSRLNRTFRNDLEFPGPGLTKENRHPNKLLCIGSGGESFLSGLGELWLRWLRADPVTVCSDYGSGHGRPALIQPALTATWLMRPENRHSSPGGGIREVYDTSASVSLSNT
jgi:hypothetical protein